MDWELVSFQVGASVSGEDLVHFQRQIEVLHTGKLWVKGFVRFQYGKLSRECKPHSPVFAALEKHGIDVDEVDQNRRHTEIVDDYLRAKIIARDGLVCVYFNEPISIEEAEIDHVVSRAKGGTDSPSNLVVSSKRANSLKSDKSLSDFCTAQNLDEIEVMQRISLRISKPIEGFRVASRRLQDKTRNGEDKDNTGQEEDKGAVGAAISADVIYSAYPRKEARQDALRAIAKAMDRVPATELLGLTQTYAAAVAAWPPEDRCYVPHPATWFNGARYHDDPATWQRKTTQVPKQEMVIPANMR